MAVQFAAMMRGTVLSMALLQSFFMANRRSAHDALKRAPAFADSVRHSSAQNTALSTQASMADRSDAVLDAAPACAGKQVEVSTGKGTSPGSWWPWKH